MGNEAFYTMKGAQKIIDYQFNTMTYYVMRGLFWFYILCFCLPFGIALTNPDRDNHDLFKICLVA